MGSEGNLRFQMSLSFCYLPQGLNHIFLLSSYPLQYLSGRSLLPILLLSSLLSSIPSAIFSCSLPFPPSPLSHTSPLLPTAGTGLYREVRYSPSLASLGARLEDSLQLVVESVNALPGLEAHTSEGKPQTSGFIPFTVRGVVSGLNSAYGERIGRGENGGDGGMGQEMRLAGQNREGRGR